MDRNREARRVTMAASGGLSRRRHRSNSLRDSPEDDVAMETQETVRLRERKKERDRERERERDRMSSRSSKRRRGGERLIHTNREDGLVGDDTSEESVNDEEDEDDDDSSIPALRMLPPSHHPPHHHNNNNSSLSSSSFNNHHHGSNNNVSSSNHHHQKKSFPPPAKVFRATVGPGSITTAVSPPWKAPDEMIGVSVPRKARSASTKRSHEWASSGGGVAEPIHRQASTSPVRSSGGGGAVMGSVSAASPAAPVSPPSSSNISVKKKAKPNGPKQRPPKSLSSSKPVSLSQDEIEIEIAEVLYGLLRQPQASNKQQFVGGDSTKVDSREMSSKPTGDAKSRVSSPISNSPSTAFPQSSSVPPSNSSSSNTPMSAIAPKRKRPRPVKYEDENPSSLLTVKNRAVGNDQSAKTESNLDKNQGSAVENGCVDCDLLANQPVASSTEAVKQENNLVPDANPSTEASESRDLGISTKEEPRSPAKESNSGMKPEASLNVSKSNVNASEVETHKEKFQIDLMAPPPPLRSSPERDSEIDTGSVDPKLTVTDVETELKPVVKEDDKAVKIAKDDINVEPEGKKAKAVPEEADSHKPIGNGNKERNIDLQLDLEKTERGSVSVSLSGNKPHVHVQNQKQHQQPGSEKNAQPNSLPLPMSMASWPGGLPSMGYMAPLQGVVSMDGTSVPSPAIQPPYLLFNQPRPKRCAMHCYIARNILYLQQLTRMNPYWPPAPGSALQFGAKTCNVNVVPSPEMLPGRAVNSVLDKGQNLAIFPHNGKDKSSQPANIVDTAQRKQILLQQALPPGAPNSILHGPAFIFPLGQQPGAPGASVRPGTIKSPPTPSTALSSSTSSSASVGTAAAPVTGAAMSFNYPNLPANETQYLAILQNGAYPIPIPAHVGANPAYRGSHPPALPFFNGSFYSSQMLHPSALPQQQPPPTQSSQNQQSQQNPSISSGSSSSQKHLQNQQSRTHASGVNGSGNLQALPSQKNLPSQSMQLQSRQQNLNHMPLQTRHLESEGGEESPSTADSRVSRSNMSIYGQNFGMPMHPPPNFMLMTPPSVTAANTANNPGDKKQQQQHQSHGSKAGTEPFQSQPFAMSFAFNGAAATPGLDISSIAPNHPLLQSIPEATRHDYFMAAAAAAGQTAQQKKNFRSFEEGKVGGNDGSNAEEQRKAMAGGKAAVASGQSIAFSRPDLTDAPGSAIPGNAVIDTSARTMNPGSNSVRATGSVMSTAVSTVSSAGVQQQMPRNQQQLFQLQHKQQQFAAAAVASTRSKPPATSNGTVFPEQITTSMAGKFPSTLSAFPQNLVQSNSSPAQSPQWKGSVRTAASQVSSPTLASTSSLKNLPQQQIRTQQGHTQISFAANLKPSAVAQGTQPPSGNQSASPPMVVGSPTRSSISRSAGGSPRTTSTSTSNKGGQTSSLSSQQAKNSPVVANQKSSPAGGRNMPSILGHSQSTISTSGSGTKPQLTQQQHLQKQYQQMFNLQAAAASSANNGSAPSGFYLQRHRGEPPQQQSQGSLAPTSTGMLSLGPPTSLTNTGTTDPAKAVAAAIGANNMKGVSLPSNYAQFAAAQSSGKGHQLVPGFSFIHPLPTPVQVKPAEQKQPAGE